MGVCGRHPWADTPLCRHITPRQTPHWQTPLPGRHPPGQIPPCPEHAGIYITPCPVHAGIHAPPKQAATAADGTHPTGMHSCWRICYRPKYHWSKTNRCTSRQDWLGMSDLRILGWKQRIFTARQRSCVKVMFSQVSVILFRRGVPCDHYPWCKGPHCTVSPNMGPHCLGLPEPPASDIWWPSLEACSILFTSRPLSADTWWLLNHIQLVQESGTHPTGMLYCIFTLLMASFTIVGDTNDM